MRIASLFALLAAVCLVWGVAGYGDGSNGPSQGQVSSRAYKGHATDPDMNHFVSIYRSTAGTLLDDCQTCHAWGDVTFGGKSRFRNACDYCHYIPFPDSAATGQPSTYAQTLNGFGLAYKHAGRNREAIEAIARLDSDGDGYSNEAEISDGRYPGSPASRPGQPKAPTKLFDMAALKAMPSHTQFLLGNAHTQKYDFYATYRGVTIKDLLLAAGVNVNEITGITVIASDGFMKDFDVSAIVNAYPAGLFFAGLAPQTLGADRGFVNYPAALPPGLTDGGPVPDKQWLLMAYERDGAPMEVSYLDAASGKTKGEGPLRIVVPQTKPGAPDRGSRYSPSGLNDGWDYDDAKDQNAGLMVRGIIAIRVNPMPGGYEAFDHMNGGWAYVEAGQLIIFGKGVK